MPKHQENSESTQVGNTKESYRKAMRMAKIRQTCLERTINVLDYGAGKGHGATVLEEFGNVAVTTFEPIPKNWTPDYTDSDDIQNSSYDVVICLNVLNVLEPALREEVLLDIMKKVKVGGMACIGVRNWSSVNTAKHKASAPEENAIWVLKSTGDCYQKGYSPKELKEYARTVLGDDLHLTASTDFCNTSIIIRK